MKARRRFPHSAGSVGAARRFVTDELDGVDPETVAQITLLVSELATNAVRHAASSFEVTVQCSRSTVTVGVTDSGGGTPTVRPIDTRHPSGRGLQLVEKLSEKWWVDQHRGNAKTVWFRFTRTAVSGRSR